MRKLNKAVCSWEAQLVILRHGGRRQCQRKTVYEDRTRMLGFLCIKCARFRSGASNGVFYNQPEHLPFTTK